jgi:hypothetical protein
LPAVPGHFGYPCPDCRSRNNLHEPDCRFADRKHHEVERAYVELLAVLSAEPMDESGLRDETEAWGPLHVAALDRLRTDERVKEDEASNLSVVPPEERKERLREPTYEPMRTIYQKGSVPGAHDNSIFAMIAFYEMVGFTWPETKRLVVEWLHESGTWARGGFEEGSPEQLLENKRHVYEEGYGWKQAAKEAKSVIDRSL